MALIGVLVVYVVGYHDTPSSRLFGLLFSGTDFRLRPSSVGYSLMRWLAAWVWAGRSTRRGPLESWLAR